MEKKRKKNVVMIMTDDQGYWSLGCAGNKDAHTPNIDRLAAEGMRFENFFCVSPVCSPGTGLHIYGKYPFRPRNHGLAGRRGSGCTEV